ncbi:MAG: response regulator [Phycisphaerales bacterium]|nr:MAG: response regulator [Phycisphaerales bacterium]
MGVNFIVGAAALFQYAAAVLALRVLRITGRDPAWLLIAAVAFLMAVRRSIVLYRSLSHDVVHPPDLAAECVGLAISVLMLVGVARIGPFFLSVLHSKEELRKRSHELEERVKELNCLYEMAGLIEQPDVSLEQLIQGTVDLIPPAWRYPEVTCARITLEGQVFATANFEETSWKLDRDIVVHGERVGVLEVYHREKKPEDDQELFLKEERHLVYAIGERLGRIVERLRAEEDREALQEQLHQARKMEAVGQLAAGVAHDFSNLLTVIRGHADRAGTMLADENRARKELEVVQEATHRGADLTRALLTFSRKLPTEKKPIDLCAVVRESQRLLRRVLPAAIELDVKAACESPLWVDADLTQVHQVVLNLAINARDAMPDGGTLRISLSPATESDLGDLPEAPDSGRSSVRLVVTDTGVGMAPEVQTHVFEPFYTTKTRGQGTGLGLSIVHGIVQDHGGHVEVRSEVGKGTTITVVLPCIRSGAVIEPVTHTVITPEGQGELLLLAEDDQHVRGIIASTLESLGYSVTLAEDGPAVLEVFAQYDDEIRLLILEADLPERNGPDCLRELRERGAKTPAIVITGKVDLDSGKLDDNTVLLRKPFGMPELASTVSDALGTDAGQET